MKTKKIKTKLLLCRNLNGKNEIVEVNDSTTNENGMSYFADFLKKVGLHDHKYGIELAQVLRVPCDKLIECSLNDGLIDHSSKENIESYLNNARLCGAQLRFLSKQHGEMGAINEPTIYA